MYFVLFLGTRSNILELLISSSCAQMTLEAKLFHPIHFSTAALQFKCSQSTQQC